MNRPIKVSLALGIAGLSTVLLGLLFFSYGGDGPESPGFRGTSAPSASVAADPTPVKDDGEEEPRSRDRRREAETAARLLKEFNSARSLAVFVRDALLTDTAVGRFYAEYAWDQCALFASQLAPATNERISEQVERHRARCGDLSLTYPDRRAFLEMLKSREPSSPHPSLTRARSNRLGVEPDKRTWDDRLQALGAAVETGDPHLTAAQLVALTTRFPTFEFDGKLLNQRDLMDFHAAVALVECELASDCARSVSSVFACLGAESACRADHPLETYYRQAKPPERFAAVERFRDELRKSFATGDFSKLKVPTLPKT